MPKRFITMAMSSSELVGLFRVGRGRAIYIESGRDKTRIRQKVIYIFYINSWNFDRAVLFAIFREKSCYRSTLFYTIFRGIYPIFIRVIVYEISFFTSMSFAHDLRRETRILFCALDVREKFPRFSRGERDKERESYRKPIFKKRYYLSHVALEYWSPNINLLTLVLRDNRFDNSFSDIFMLLKEEFNDCKKSDVFQNRLFHPTTLTSRALLLKPVGLFRIVPAAPQRVTGASVLLALL